MLAACSSGSGSPQAGPSTNASASTATPQTIVSKSQWDAGAIQQVLALGREIGKTYKGECADNAFLPRDEYVAQVQKFKYGVPLAVADCTAFGDTIELSAFPSDAVRDAWNEDRTK